MKKYSSYFNKRYFPEPEDAEEEEPLSGESLAAPEEAPPVMEPPKPAPEPVPTPPPAPAAPPAPPAPPARAAAPAGAQDAFSFPPFEMPDLDAPDPIPEPEPFTPPAPAFSVPEAPEPPKEVETTVISESAIINGELTVEGNIKMLGKIKGNMTATGNLEIAGKVIGNLSGNDVELSQCELKGDINATGFTFMDKESIMIGNLNSQDVTLDGKVKGDVSATHKVYVRSNAVIVGNVRAAVIAIDEGAALQGQVIIASKDGDGDSLQIGGDDE